MSRKTSGKPSKKRKASKPRQPLTQPRGSRRADAPLANEQPVEDDGELLVAAWQASRSGARAGRGFHFQDAVAAWLAARVATGEIEAASITPEGLEDIVLEGSETTEIQVKSRVAHLGGFPPRLASRHILDAWDRHASRAPHGGRLVVVLERGVDGEDGLSSLGACLAYSLANDSVLRQALADLADEREMAGPLSELLASTVVLGTTWEEISNETAASVRILVELAPSALGLITRQLRSLVAEASDANAALGVRQSAISLENGAHRRGISRRIAHRSRCAGVRIARRSMRSLRPSRNGRRRGRSLLRRHSDATVPCRSRARRPTSRCGCGGSGGSERTVGRRHHRSFRCWQECSAMDRAPRDTGSPLVPRSPSRDGGRAGADPIGSSL